MGSQICFWAVLVLTLVPCSAACCIFEAQHFPRSFTLWIDKILISETGPYTARPTCHTNREPRDRPSSWPQVLCLLDGPRTLHLTLYLVPKSSYLQIPILSFSQESAQTSMKKAVSLPHRTWIGDYFLNGELCSWHGEDWKCGSSKKCGGSSTSHFCESQSACALRRWTTFFFLKKGVRSLLRLQLYANTLLKKKALGESYLYPTGIAHAKGEAVNLRVSRSGCSHDVSTSLLFWWHTIPVSNCQVVPGRRRHNHSVILEQPCMFLSSRASWPELFLRIRFTTTSEPLVIGAFISFPPKQVQTRLLKSHHMAHLLPFGFRVDSWN